MVKLLIRCSAHSFFVESLVSTTDMHGCMKGKHQGLGHGPFGPACAQRRYNGKRPGSWKGASDFIALFRAD